MLEISRRALFSGAAAAAATTIFTESAPGQLVWQKSDWHAAELEALTRSTRRIKQVIHATAIEGGRFLRNARNSLNGLRFGFGVPADQIQMVCVLNGPANLLNYSDESWEKYRAGEWAKLDDPKTGQPAVRNIFYPSKAGSALHYAAEDPNSEDSSFQDASIQGLQSRGVRFLSCHSSVEEQARALIQHNNLSAPPEEVAKDILAHALPGVLVVPSAAAALAVLQCDGHYSYLAVS